MGMDHHKDAVQVGVMDGEGKEWGNRVNIRWSGAPNKSAKSCRIPCRCRIAWTRFFNPVCSRTRLIR